MIAMFQNVNISDENSGFAMSIRLNLLPVSLMHTFSRYVKRSDVLRVIAWERILGGEERFSSMSAELASSRAGIH